uniref:uncharacterized protein LOC120345079 n=1 Tax=Styela clava TaxID=7725 RepID=UPI00193A23BE|nr:uncharacterized protein LOC120345079 [Styela clava]
MYFVKLVYLITLICGLFAKKLPAGSCVSTIKNGKLVQVGNCQKNDGSEIARLIKKSLDEKKQIQTECGVVYNSKCYRAIAYKIDNVTLKDAKLICKSLNYGKPANIYDLTHYNLLHTYLLSVVPAGLLGTDVFTGMQYKNNQLLLTNGEAVTLPPEVWYPDNPKSHVTHTSVGIVVNKDPDNKLQGVFTGTPSWPEFGVVCEI